MNTETNHETTANAAPEYLTITLTDRAPVRIVKTDWPCIASAQGLGPSMDGKTHTWRLTVRRHSDGRTLAYGRSSSSDPTERIRAGGALLDAWDEAAGVSAIKAVGDSLGMPKRLIQSCIADLPAVTI